MTRDGNHASPDFLAWAMNHVIQSRENKEIDNLQPAWATST
jgi:hypothetical protein